MNKKLFLGMLAAAGVLFSTSCSKNELDSGLSKNQAEITFSLTAEDGIATRANISDGTKADVLVYAVFDKDGKRLSGIKAVRKTSVTFPTTENIILAKGQTYKVAFWAQDEDCKAYTVDTDKMTVSVNYANDENKVNNDETRDAFFRTVEFTVTGSTSIDVEMRRPFAQINVGVTDKDWKDAVASGINIDQSKVVIKNAATTLNLLDGTVGDDDVDVTYDLSTIPAETLMVDTDNDGIKEKYHWLSMSYILPNDTKDGYSKTTLENIAFEFAPANDAYSHIYFNQGLNNVPVQRNWRTNILGRLLTGDITFNIVIDPVYENDHNVMTPYATIGGTAYASFADAMAAVQDGETIKLEGETTLQGIADSKLFTVNKNITIDLNGYGFVANMPDVTKANTAIFQVKNGGTLNVKGEGNVKVVTNKAPGKLVALISNEGGNVNLYGGNWTMTACDNWEDALIPTFVDNNSTLGASTLNIYDGTYTFNRNLFRNFANHNTEVATMNIYGGTFNGRESDAGAIWNQKPNSELPNGAGVINFVDGTLNNVVIIDEFAGVVYVNSQDELNEALKNVNIHTIMLGAGEYKADIYNGTPKRKSLAIIGSEGTKFGHTAATGGQLRLELFDSFTIKNCEIIKRSGSGFNNWGHIVFGSSNNADGVYTIENCTFNGVGTQGIYINENTSGATYNIKNCTFNGDFGSKDGAITIQNNENVDYTVNVTGCTFTNLPETSHKINVIYKDNGGLNLVVDGKVTAAQPSQLAAILTSDAEEIFVSLNNDITVPITSLGNQTAGSGEYKLGGESTKKITIDLNGKKLDITTTYWSAIGAKNNDAIITIKNGTMTSTGNSAVTWNAWDVRLSNCNYVIEDVTFEKEVALDNAGKSTTMKNVTIKGTGDKYALWITAEGQKVTIDNLTVNSEGRGIKIDEQYVDVPSKVTMSISNSKFTTANKAAVIVKSVAGAEINWGAGNDISNVAADNEFAVWVDEDAAAYADKVVVYGANVRVESDVVVSTDTDFASAIENGGTVILQANVKYTPSSALKEDVVINLNNSTFETTNTVKLEDNADLTMVDGDYVVNSTYGHVDVRPDSAEGSVVTYENVDFSYNKLNKTYGSSTNRLGSVVEICPAAAGAQVVIKFKNCTFGNAKVLFEGLSDKTGTFDAVFEKCTFNALTSSAPIEVQNYITGNIKVVDCTFNLECTSSTASGISVSSSSSTSVTVTADNNTFNAIAATPSGTGGTEEQVKVNGTPANIKFISYYENTTVTETGTVKTGIAAN